MRVKPLTPHFVAPVGLFAPTFLVGALVGRTYYILVEYIDDQTVDSSVLGDNFTTAAAGITSLSGFVVVLRKFIPLC